MAGAVFSGERKLAKPGDLLAEDAPLEVRGKDHPWVSRGGIKLDHGLTHFGFDATGAVALDVGSSTGGFTDVLLSRGAAKVYAVDVGTNQLAWKLRQDPRVVVHEQTNARNLDATVIPEPVDAKNPEAWREDALFQPETRAAFRTLVNLGLTDAVRACHPGPGIYTFWDYQAGAWQKDHGIRIDHILLSPQAADRLQSAGIDKFTRGWEKPSDHVPVWVELRE